MRPETKKLIQDRIHRYLPGEETHALDSSGCWLHVRDIRSIINCEIDLVRQTLEKVKAENEYLRKSMEGKPIALTSI